MRSGECALKQKHSIPEAREEAANFFRCMFAVWGVLGIGVVWLHLTKKAARSCMILAADSIGNYALANVVYDDETVETVETVETEVTPCEEGYDTAP